MGQTSLLTKRVHRLPIQRGIGKLRHSKNTRSRLSNILPHCAMRTQCQLTERDIEYIYIIYIYNIYIYIYRERERECSLFSINARESTSCRVMRRNSKIYICIYIYIYINDLKKGEVQGIINESLASLTDTTPNRYYIFLNIKYKFLFS